jgi:hypothetical protein
MNLKHAIAGATIIIATALGATALTQTGVFDPGPATALAPAGADPYPGGGTSPTQSRAVVEPVRLMTAETAEFEVQVYTSDDAPQVVGMDPGIYFVPAWGADRDTSILYV